jgi:hypothetical protein
MASSRKVDDDPLVMVVECYSPSSFQAAGVYQFRIIIVVSGVLTFEKG